MFKFPSFIPATPPFGPYQGKGPRHFGTPVWDALNKRNKLSGACHSMIDVATEVVAEVTCKLCKRTKKYKQAQRRAP